MKLIALVRPPSANLEAGERAHVERTPINFALAQAQHAGYVQALHDAGVQIIEVPVAPHLPDAVFIEDTALVLDTLTVIARSCVESRRAETAAVTAVLSRYRYLAQPPPAVCFDGGDILAIDRTVYIGRTSRTNAAAVDYLTTLLRQYYYKVVPVPVSGCVHLKSSVAYLGENMVLINRDWVPEEAFAKHLRVDVAMGEPLAANALRIGNRVLMSASYPRTAKRVEAYGLLPKLIDISEFHRAGGGLSRLAILYYAEHL